MNQPDLFDLTGRHALVTGASRGIGFAIAAEMHRRGASLAITGRKLDVLQVAANNLGEKAFPVVCHQGDQAAIANLFTSLDQHRFIPDIVVINAATNPVMGPLAEIDLGAWQKILDVNLTGALGTAQQALARMLPRRKGSIIFIASIAGIDPMPGLGAYSVSKAGLITLTKALAKEVGPQGIRVNAVAPGLIETKFSSALFQDAEKYRQIVSPIALGRHGQTEDVVGAALFLACEASAYMTGQVLVVDGGARM